MKPNRRSLLGILAGTPFAARAVAENVASGLNAPLVPPRVPFPGGGASGADRAQNVAQQAAQPRMPLSEARRLIFGDEKALAEIRSELFAEMRYVTLDADIDAMRSWSRMAKITFQRQRDVERALDDLGNERHDAPQRYLRAFTTRVRNLMWGE